MVNPLYLAADFKYKIYFTASVESDFSNEFSLKKYYHNHNQKNPDTNSIKMIPEKKKKISKWLFFFTIMLVSLLLFIFVMLGLEDKNTTDNRRTAQMNLKVIFSAKYRTKENGFKCS